MNNQMHYKISDEENKLYKTFLQNPSEKKQN